MNKNYKWRKNRALVKCRDLNTIAGGTKKAYFLLFNLVKINYQTNS